MKLKCESCKKVFKREKYDFVGIENDLVILKCPNCSYESAFHKRIPETQLEIKNKIQTEVDNFLEEKGYEIKKRIGKTILPKKNVIIQFNNKNGRRKF